MATVTNEQLQAARLAVEQTREPYDEARRTRNALVKQALTQGMRHAHVAREAGLTRSGVGKVAKSRP